MATSSISSGLLNADTAIFLGKNRVNSVTVLTDGTNAATLVIYDNASAASGTVVHKMIVAGATRTNMVVFQNPVVVSNGIYADITGTGAEYIIHYGG